MRITNEKAVARLWQSCRLSSLQDDLGNNFEVVCPGRVSNGPGCDFQDVVISYNGERKTGDVEVHLTSDLWKKHGHNSDPAYNGVILHVAMWQKGALPVRLEAGTPLPTAILSRHIGVGDLQRFRISSSQQRCPQAGRQTRRLLQVIVGSGMKRLEAKAEGLDAALLHGEPEQVLYKGICRALGYAKNVRPFETLADRLTVRYIYETTAGNLAGKQAALLGSAGLLGLWGISSAAADLESEWSGLSWEAEPLSIDDWHFCGVRPANHPVRRLDFMAQLLHRHEKDGLLGTFLRAIMEAAAGSEPGCLERLLLPDEEPGLLGRGRAREIVVNQVLPFLLAYGVRRGDLLLVTKAVSGYAAHGPLPGNELQRYMQGLLGLGRGLNACAQQGLLHIYHTFCRTKDCARCPVSTRQKPGPV